MKRTEPQDSPVIQFLQVLWDKSQKSTSKSWLRLNQSLRTALMLTIKAGFEFHLTDLKDCSRFRSGYWFGSEFEEFYRLAVFYRNNSAWKAYEHYMGRIPFIVPGANCHAHLGGGPMGQGLSRLVNGAQFTWKGERVTVTSFNDTSDPKSFTACSYIRPEIERAAKIHHRYTITHAMLTGGTQN